MAAQVPRTDPRKCSALLAPSGFPGYTRTVSAGCIVDQRHMARQPEVKNVADDRMRGQVDETKGVIKEKVGKITGDRSTEVSGKLDQVKGKVEKKIGQAKDTRSR